MQAYQILSLLRHLVRPGPYNYCTVCPGSSDKVYKVTYYIKWVVNLYMKTDETSCSFSIFNNQYKYMPTK